MTLLMITEHAAKVRPALWDLSQKIFGADEEKKRLYFEPLQIKSRESRVLDFGCATGNTAAPFVGYDYTGLDIDPVLIDYARFKFRRHPEMKFVAHDVTTFEPPKPYEYILFAGVAHHLDEALLPTILRRLRSFLTSDGHLYFVDPVIAAGQGRLVRFLMSLDQGKFHRATNTYAGLFETLGMQVLEHRILRPRGTLFPQPEYAFFKVR